MPDTILLVDAMNIMHRSYYGYPSLVDGAGRSTGALYGFVSYLKSLCKNHSVRNIIICSDAHRQTFRNDIYPPYKGHRDETPVDLKEQFSYMEKYIELSHLNFIKMDGFEADDLIGTLATKAKDYNYKVLIASGDKDLMQLIEDNVIEQLYLSNKGIMHYTSKEVGERFGGLSPKQIIDLKGLSGDPSDNIPGVTRIGEKTAIKLLNTYQTLDNVYAHLEDFKGAQLKNLTQDKEMAYLSQKLATIKTDIPLDFEKLFTMHPDMALCTPDSYDYLKSFKINLFNKTDIQQATTPTTPKEPTVAPIVTPTKVVAQEEKANATKPKRHVGSNTLNQEVTSLELPFDICDTGDSYVFRSLSKYAGEATKEGLSIWLYALMYCPEIRPLTMELLKKGKELLCVEDESNIEKIAKLELNKKKK